MPQLSKTQFADLVRSMPDASDDEILAEAKKREAQSGSEPSLLGKVWEKANAPLTDAPSRIARKAGEAIDQRSLDESPTMAKVKGFAHGALEGVGDVVSSLTSPLNIALTATGAGGAKAGAKGLLGISKAARGVEAALSAPLVAEGAHGVYEGVKEGDLGKVGAGIVEAAGGGAGVHGAFKHSFPVQKVSEAYMAERGLSKDRVKPHEPVKVNPEEAKAVADAYQDMPHNPDDPQTAQSYKALQDEVKKQFLFVRDKAGLKMEPKTEGYKSSADMVKDVKENNNLNYFPSEEGFGDGKITKNPLLEVDPETGLAYNDMFRAIHDYFGHAKEGHQFGPSGEENAWLTHQKMFSREAVPAMTSETRGQNSWVNSGPHLRDIEGNIPKKGEPGFISPQDRPFAPQKTGLLPTEFHSRRDGRTQAAPVGAAVALESPSEVGRQAPGEGGDSTGRPVHTSEGTSSVSERTQGASSRPVYDLDRAASIVDQLTSKNDGSTFNLYKGDLSGTQHYSVSAYPERGRVVEGKPSPEQVKQFIHQNQDILQDPKNSIGTWFNPEDGKTYLDISVTTPDLKEASTLGKAKNQKAIFDLGKFETISLEPHPTSEFTPVGEEPPHSRPTFKDPKASAFERVMSKQGGQAALGAALPIGMAIPDDPDSQLDDYGRVGMAILSAGALAAGVRGRQVKNLSPVQDAVAKGAAALWVGGKKAWAQAVGPHASPAAFAASQKLLDRHLATTEGKLTTTKKLLAMNKAGAADATWYDSAYKELQDAFGKDAPLVARFFAATSNNATVSSNASLTLKALRQYKSGEPFTGYLPAVIENLNLAAKGEPLNGRKIDNFAKALSDDPNAVVADRWIMRAFGIEKGTAPTDTQYDFIENTIKQIAEKTGQTPRQVQAAIWFDYKNRAEKGKNRPPTLAPGASMQHSINLRHQEALTENRKFDRAKQKEQNAALPF